MAQFTHNTQMFEHNKHVGCIVPSAEKRPLFIVFMDANDLQVEIQLQNKMLNL